MDAPWWIAIGVTVLVGVGGWIAARSPRRPKYAATLERTSLTHFRLTNRGRKALTVTAVLGLPTAGADLATTDLPEMFALPVGGVRAFRWSVYGGNEPTELHLYAREFAPKMLRLAVPTWPGGPAGGDAAPRS